ncbi:hypothetical protein BOX15_Mlig028927g4 [Macrostomum lignano]|uniref:Uncharacterized protein n=2 Tax=Macrostomum lignano TaxID=282301 RepID=A0A267FP66_9PLAT|nr:hypothetical protein BOX15_Mlig028927g2 [Macrostomum lignano]PAA54336.1 hypothetical protein BOX15_Mlig028927g1 [Macrostomum lignano]PAA75610.1 hypothetical protein BOX15_Mlig028927g4 [Macrostomum lignano]
MPENQQMFGVWKAYKSENMAAVLEKAGAPWMARKMGANATPTVTLTRVDDKQIKMTTKSAIFSMDQIFVVGEIVEFKPPFQNESQTFLTEWTDDGRLIFFQGPAGSDVKNTGIKQIRSLEPNGEMLVTSIQGDVTGYRWFKREN